MKECFLGKSEEREGRGEGKKEKRKKDLLNSA
jgi:hypothetical protein